MILLGLLALVEQVKQPSKYTYRFIEATKGF